MYTHVKDEEGKIYAAEILCQKSQCWKVTEPGYTELSITFQSPLFIEIKLIKYAKLKVKKALIQERKVKKGWKHCFCFFFFFKLLFVCLFNLAWMPFSRYQWMLWFQFQHWRLHSYFNSEVSIWFKTKTSQSTCSIYSLVSILSHFFWKY